MTAIPIVYHDKPYLELGQRILATGNDRGDRTGTGTRSLFGQQLRFDLSSGFPLLTTKQVFFKTLTRELLWFLTGSTNIRPLVLQKVNIWNEWPYVLYRNQLGLPPKSEISSEEWDAGLKMFVQKIADDEEFANQHGDLGPLYGSQWRKWTGREFTVDQIAALIRGLKENPDGRDHLVSAWNPEEHQWLRRNSLPPCHVLFQCYVANGRLSLHLYQRSCDMFLGVPFNIASYALLTHMLAHVTGLLPGDFVWTGGDVHIYNNHFDQMREQLTRQLLPSPQLQIVGNVADIDSFTIENFELVGYKHQGKISGTIAV